MGLGTRYLPSLIVSELKPFAKEKCVTIIVLVQMGLVDEEINHIADINPLDLMVVVGIATA